MSEVRRYTCTIGVMEQDPTGEYVSAEVAAEQARRIEELVEALRIIHTLMRKDATDNPFRGYANPRGEVINIAAEALAKNKGASNE